MIDGNNIYAHRPEYIKEKLESVLDEKGWFFQNGYKFISWAR